jgi:flavin reductase (DIM6/NTAB) family NADH-FMN oxidoreductase RutF
MYYGFPVILVSFYDENGEPNVTSLSSSYSLKNMVALGLNSKGYAASQIKKSKDFVINLAHDSLLEAVTFCGSHSGYEHKKFEGSGLTPVKSEVVNAPIIKECPVSIECTLTDSIEKENYGGLTNLLGEIKGRLVANEYLDEEGRIQTDAFHNIFYFGDGKKKGFQVK